MNVRKNTHPFLPIVLIVFSLFLGLNILISLLDIKLIYVKTFPFWKIKKNSSTHSNIMTDADLKTFSDILQKYGLMEKSVLILEDYINKSSITRKDAGILYYDVAEELFKLQQYKKSLFYILKAKLFIKNSLIHKDLMSKQIICMKKIGLNLDQFYFSEPEKETDQNITIFAKINHEIIDEKKFNEEMLPLKLEEKNQITTNKQVKSDFLKYVILRQILFKHALNLGVDNDPDIISKINAYKKTLLIQAALNVCDIDNTYIDNLTDNIFNEHNSMQNAEILDSLIKTFEKEYKVEIFSEKL